MTSHRYIADQSQANELAWQLRDRVSGYSAEFGGRESRIQLVDEWNRPNSTLYAFVVSAETGDQRLLVKIPREWAAAGTTGNGAAVPRPRLFPMPDSDGKAEMEYSALSRIRDHFSELNDSRFGAMRILDLLQDRRALVMEHVPHASLSRLLVRSCGLVNRPTNLETVIRNAGSWLRIYHQLPGLTHTRDRHETRADFLRALGEFAGFLATAHSDADWVESVTTRVESLAKSMLPEVLPLGMSHGDYAPRNIFVAPGEQVIVFDTLARWRAPIYEDIAHFLVALKLARVQVYSLGLAFNETSIARYDQEFLRGYFQDDVVPLGAIRLFEKLLLMDKWTALMHQYQRSTGILRLARRSVLSLWSRCIRRHLDQPVSQPAPQAVFEMS